MVKNIKNISSPCALLFSALLRSSNKPRFALNIQFVTTSQSTFTLPSSTASLVIRHHRKRHEFPTENVVTKPRIRPVGVSERQTPEKIRPLDFSRTQTLNSILFSNTITNCSPRAVCLSPDFS